VSEVLYRKWRPQSFFEVVGQDAVTQTLRNSVSSGRLAHAYLFCGPRGTGKTTLGRLLAKAVNCAAPADGEPCNNCESCRAFIEGRAVDFVEQDAASHNSVDDIRQLRENVVLTPMAGGRKVYLLDEVHMLSTAADNALLKTLEEPPPHIVFVLATTEPHKVSATIISRCQRFDLRRIANAAVVKRLAFICEQESYTLEEGALDEIARASGGSLRDAINALEQVITYYGPAPSLEQVREALGLTIDARSGELVRHTLDNNLAEALKTISAVRDDGAEMKQFARQVTLYLRGLLLAKAGAGEALDLPREMANEVKEAATSRDRAAIVRALRAFGAADFRDDPYSSLPLELAVLGLTSEEPARAAVPQPAATAPVPVATRATPLEPEPEATASIPTSGPDEVAPTPATASFEPSPEPAQTNGAQGPPVAGPGGEDPLLDRVRLACRETDKTLAALLNGSCEVLSTDDNSVVLGFYHTFHLERAESEPNAGKLAKLFSDALGSPVIIRFEKHAAPERKSAGGGHLVQAAKELGARPVSPGNSDEGGDNG
jgi:DNA polymerase-3 subunit gamma/tau